MGVLALALLAGLSGALGGSLVSFTDRGAGQVSDAGATPAQPALAEAEPPAAQAQRRRRGADAPTQVEAVAEAVLPTVVRVDISGDGDLAPLGNGSGVIYRADGYIITNNHVVADARAVRVAFADGTEADAEIVGRDPLSDLAVIKVDREGLPVIPVGDSSQLRVGQLAVAIGSPFGLQGSVTAGVISALNRPISVGEGVRIPNVVQTDAPINPGNSGGPLVGADGRLIGINSAILTNNGSPANAGVGFAIPTNTAVDIADELIESGVVIYPFLGVTGQDVTGALAERVAVAAGAFLQTVPAGTPAAEAGLAPGDIVTRFGDKAIGSMDDLIVAVRQARVGQQVAITYLRQGDLDTVRVTLVERPDGL